MNPFQKKVTAVTAGLALVFGLAVATPAVFATQEDPDEVATILVVDEEASKEEAAETTETESEASEEAEEVETKAADAVNVEDLQFGEMKVTRTDKGFTEGAKEGEFGDYLSQIEARSYKVVIPVEGATEAEIQQLINDGKFNFEINRTEEEARNTLKLEDAGTGTWCQKHLGWDYLFLGGNMDEWVTRAAKDRRNGIYVDSKPFFKNMELNVESTLDGKTVLVYTFDNEMLFGIDGNDVRFRYPLRSATLDYTGDFHFNMTSGDEQLATTTIHFRPFDEYLLQNEIDTELDKAEATANANGLYAKVFEYGTSANGRPMRAIIIAQSKSDIDRYREIKVQAEENPTEVIKQLDAGTLEGYKAPIFYTNIHPDELTAPAGLIEFMNLMVENKEVPYKQWTDLTEAGKKELAEERAADGVKTSELVKDYFTGMGYIRGKNADGTYGRSNGKYANGTIASSDLTQEEIDKYYVTEEKTYNPSKVMDHCFFVLVPSENVDARSINSRPNGNGFDLNRDNTYQTQPETTAMSRLITAFNPISLHEFHGFYKHYQLEPCSPTHDPSNEYDLFIETAAEMNERFASVSLANTNAINSCQIPMRDFMTANRQGKYGWWAPFDDVSTSYTPQYSMMHGVNAYTIELPWGDSDAVRAVKYGCIGNAEYVSENWQKLFKRQVKRYERAVNNIDADEIRPFYVDWEDNAGAWADIYRPRDKKDVMGKTNNNFFPEYYVFPMDYTNQKDRKAACETINLLIRNGVKVDKLAEPVTYGNKTYPAGTVFVNMRQAKRNVAQGVLYENFTIQTSQYMFYSEPVSNFSWFRNFDMDEIRTEDVFANAEIYHLDEAPKQETAVQGEGTNVIVKNNGIEAVKLVNAMLKDGVNVGLITDGANKGDYVVSAKDFKPYMEKFVANVIATNDVPEAKLIQNDINVFIPLGEASIEVDGEGKPLGMTNYSNHYNTEGNWDFVALRDQLGFNVTWDVEDADVIVGNQMPNDESIEAVAAKVKAGTPYVGYTGNACAFVKQEINDAVDFTTKGKWQDPSTGKWYYWAGWTTNDALAHVAYPTDSLVTATYAADETDDLMYAMGGNMIIGIPEGAETLITVKDEPFVEGVMDKATHDEYVKDSVQAIHFDNIYLFANSLDNKGHQQHDYRYISNSIYDALLTDAAYKNDSDETISGTVDDGTQTDPVDPVDPTDPVNPEKPEVNPNQPGGDNENSTPAEQHKPSNNGGKLMSTGDPLSMAIPGVIAGGSAIAFGVSTYLRKKQD